MTDDTLRPQRSTLRTLIVCFTLGCLGACVVEAVRAAATAYAAAACAAAGQSWGGVTGSCDAPPLELHVTMPEPAPKRDPLLGPGGA